MPCDKNPCFTQQGLKAARLSDPGGPLCWAGCSPLRVKAAMILSLVRKTPSPSAASLMAFPGLAYCSGASNSLICALACGLLGSVFRQKSWDTCAAPSAPCWSGKGVGSPGLRITHADCRNIVKSLYTGSISSAFLTAHPSEPVWINHMTCGDKFHQRGMKGADPLCSRLCSAMWLSQVCKRSHSPAYARRMPITKTERACQVVSDSMRPHGL